MQYIYKLIFFNIAHDYLKCSVSTTLRLTPMLPVHYPQFSLYISHAVQSCQCNSVYIIITIDNYKSGNKLHTVY